MICTETNAGSVTVALRPMLEVFQLRKATAPLLALATQQRIVVQVLD